MTGLEIKKLIHTLARTNSGITEIHMTKEAFLALMNYLNESASSLYGSGPMPCLDMNNLQIRGIRIKMDEN